MNQIERYTLLEQFHKEQFQTIHMAIHKDREHEIALVNRIDRNGPLSEETFLQLVRHLNNVSFYELSEDFTLVTQYHGGMPLLSYVSNIRLNEDDRLQLFNDVLRGVMDYDTLPAAFQSALMDVQQIVVNKGTVNFNEILFLKHLQNPVDFHQRIRDIGNLILKDVDNPIAKQLLAFLQSQSFTDNLSIKSIFSQCQRLLHGDTLFLVDEFSPQPQSVYIAVDPFIDDNISAKDIDVLSVDSSTSVEPPQPIESQPIESEPIESDSFESEPIESQPVEAESAVESTTAETPAPNSAAADIVSAPTISEIHIGLTEKRQEPHSPERDGKKRGTLRFLWQGLFLVLLLLAGMWYVFLKEETPPQPFASYQVIASKSGWTLQSNALAYSPATLSKYQWKVMFNSEMIAESDAPEFTFMPKENGDYQIILTVTDSYGQISKPFINVLHFDGALEVSDNQATTVAPQNPLGGIAPSSTPGETVEDTVNFHGAPSSQRLYMPADKRYGILQQKGIFVSKGDVLSIWLRASDLKAIDLYLVGYKDDKAVYEQSWKYTPVSESFEKTQHTFEAHGLDRVELFVQSVNEYIWFDSYSIDTIK